MIYIGIRRTVQVLSRQVQVLSQQVAALQSALQKALAWNEAQEQRIVYLEQRIGTAAIADPRISNDHASVATGPRLRRT